MQLFTHTLILGSLLIATACSETSTPETKVPVEKPAVIPNDEKPDISTEKLISETITLAGVTLQIRAKGILKPREEYQIAIGLMSGEQGADVRLWIGEKTKAGSMVNKANGHGDHYHAHAEVPDEVTPQTALWIEVQSVTGETETGSVALQ
ncbi:MAG: hypothetical protein H8E91_06785 [Planctomycetes bacterium]|nr:hypothetical protein [Planctomycetota bacterium]MBL6997915.1 hypothetical protein [Phycisphaerales bacterium]